MTNVDKFINEMRQRKKKLAVVTSSWNKKVTRVLKRYNLQTHLEALSTSDLVTNSKPHPELYILACKLLKIKDLKIAMAIEDSKTGVQSAKAAGLYCLGLGGLDLIAAGADRVVKDFNELIE